MTPGRARSSRRPVKGRSRRPCPDLRYRQHDLPVSQIHGHLDAVLALEQPQADEHRQVDDAGDGGEERQLLGGGGRPPRRGAERQHQRHQQHRSSSSGHLSSSAQPPARPPRCSCSPCSGTGCRRSPPAPASGGWGLARKHLSVTKPGWQSRTEPVARESLLQRIQRSPSASPPRATRARVPARQHQARAGGAVDTIVQAPQTPCSQPRCVREIENHLEKIRERVRTSTVRRTPGVVVTRMRAVPLFAPPARQRARLARGARDG